MKRSAILAVALLIIGGLGWTTGSVITSVAAQPIAVQVAANQTTTFNIENMSWRAFFGVSRYQQIFNIKTFFI